MVDICKRNYIKNKTNFTARVLLLTVKTISCFTTFVSTQCVTAQQLYSLAIFSYSA